jgi:circadian clock protein KaiB
MTAPAVSGRWTLTLYVDGACRESIRAIETVRTVCDEELAGQADLEVIDVRQHPDKIAGDPVVAVPTLVRRFPGPVRCIVGNLADAARIRRGLGIRQDGPAAGRGE